MLVEYCMFYKKHCHLESEMLNLEEDTHAGSALNLMCNRRHKVRWVRHLERQNSVLKKQRSVGEISGLSQNLNLILVGI